MPDFFHRQKPVAHSVQTRHVAPGPSSSAASSAAALAFSKSNPSLSASAAAAAIKKHPQSPTNVANAPTKRRSRQNSTSSNASSRPGMERRTSLTERSLRSPSPGRERASSRSPADAPPVPALPSNGAGLERNTSGRQRAASLEPPLRLSSPPSSRQGGRGVSLDRAPKSPIPAKAASKLPQLSEQAVGPQRSSVNFSRPMSPSPQSSPSPTSPSAPTGWFGGPVVSGGTPRESIDSVRPQKATTLSPAIVSGIQTGLQGTANQPVKKKKKKRVLSATEGSHLSQGGMGITGTAVEYPTQQVPPSPTTSVVSDIDGPKSPRGSMDSSRGTQAEDNSRPYKTRAGALLARQPSTVAEAPELADQSERANTGKKVEAAPSNSPLDAARVGASSPAPTDGREFGLKSKTAEPTTPSQNGAVARVASISPARATHFSSKPEYLNGIKHEPLRSLSPAKSALKHSPSNSVGDHSPDSRFPSNPSSEVGDSGAGKKKPHRVSFDENPQVLSGLSTSRYASQSPQRSRGAIEPDLDDMSTPRPALPTFGSVRPRKDEESSSTKSMGLSNDRVVGGILAQNFASNLPANGILRKEGNGKVAHDPSLPLAPQVTSVEGSGYSSDTESNYSTTHAEASKVHTKSPDTIAEAVTTIQASESKSQQVMKHAGDDQASMPRRLSHSLDPVPTIAVLPATPAAEEEKEKELTMPGAFPDTEDQDIQPAAPAPTPLTEGALSRQTQAAGSKLRFAEPESDSESDNSSVWSDAEEDLSGPGGFASLNSILSLPAPAAAPGLALSKHAPTIAMSTTEEPPSPTAAHWSEATAYWRSLSEQKKKELEGNDGKAKEGSESEYEDSSDDDAQKAATVEPPRPATPPMPKKSKRTQPKLESPIMFASAPLSAPNEKAKQEPKLRSTMRDTMSMSVDDSPPTRSSMRTSMRDSSQPNTGDDHQMRSSMRGAQPTPKNTRRHSGGLDDSRWSSPPPDGNRKGVLKKGTQVDTNSRPITAPVPKTTLRTTAGAAPKVPAAPSLRRTGSADSASSFRRQRAGSSVRGGSVVSMRRSMRGEPSSPQKAQFTQEQPQSPVEPRKSSRFSIRSLSPMGRGEPRHMRGSMRQQSSDNTVSTLRNQKLDKKSRLKSPSRMGFGKTKQPPMDTTPPRAAVAPIAPAAPTSGFQSRFADDSDDEAPAPAFISRFADSDDELDDSPQQKNLTPVRGIPRRAGNDDGDSTDLDDSDHERPPVPAVPTLKDIEKAHGKSFTNGHNGAGSVLSAGSLRNGKSGLGASKHAPPARPESKRRMSWLGLGSSAKKRSSSTPPMDLASPPPSRDGKPKLQRRTTPNGLPNVPEDSDVNWPLPIPPRIGGDDDRPNTSEGVGNAMRAGTMRPDAGKRRSTADYVGNGMGTKSVGFNFENGDPVYSQRTGRKKKFGALRKMFGLHD